MKYLDAWKKYLDRYKTEMLPEIMDKIELIIAVLNCRREIVERAIKACQEQGRREDELYYKGKVDGYDQTLDLLSDTDESIKIELQ